MNYHIKLDPFQILGVSFGTSTPELWHTEPNLDYLRTLTSDEEIGKWVEIAKHQPIIVAKIPGGQHWRDRIAGYVYHGATFKVFEVEKVVNGTYHCRELTEFPIRKDKDK
jgi:hypothetical protein